MNTLEQEILQRVRELDADKQQHVLDFVTELQTETPLTARELMRLTPEERKRCVQAAFEAVTDEDFEISLCARVGETTSVQRLV